MPYTQVAILIDGSLLTNQCHSPQYWYLIYNRRPILKQLRLVAEAGLEPASLRYERNKEPLLYSAISTRLKKKSSINLSLFCFSIITVFAVRAFFILHIYYNIFF